MLPLPQILVEGEVITGAVGVAFTVTTVALLAAEVQPLLIALTVKLAEVKTVRGLAVVASLHK